MGIGCIYPLVKGCEEKNNFYSEWHPQHVKLNLHSLPSRVVSVKVCACRWKSRGTVDKWCNVSVPVSLPLWVTSLLCL